MEVDLTAPDTEKFREKNLGGGLGFGDVGPLEFPRGVAGGVPGAGAGRHPSAGGSGGLGGELLGALLGGQGPGELFEVAT